LKNQLYFSERQKLNMAVLLALRLDAAVVCTLRVIFTAPEYVYYCWFQGCTLLPSRAWWYFAID